MTIKSRAYKVFGSVFFMILVFGSHVSAQTSESTGEDTSATSRSELEVKTTENLNEAREALKFGVDATVMGVIKQARDGKDKRLIEEIIPLLGSPNADVAIAVLDYLTSLEEYSRVLDTCVRMIDSYQDMGDKLLVRILTFFRAAKFKPDESARKVIRELASLTSKERQIQAITTIGELDFQDSLTFLRELYSKSEIGIEQQKAIIQAIGNKKSLDQLDFLKDLIEDGGIDKELRRTALIAVGKLADDSILPIIRKAMVSTDLFERGAAIGALEGFDLGKVDDLYRQALRDAAWRHRVTVIKQISDRKLGSFTEALQYMAQKDNERPVRQAALQALVVGDQSWNLFNDWLKDKKLGFDFKVLLTNELTRKHGNRIISGLRDVINQEYKVPGSRLLEAIAKDMASAQ